MVRLSLNSSQFLSRLFGGKLLIDLIHFYDKFLSRLFGGKQRLIN